MRRLAPALGLFFLSPLVAEYLLGDLPVTLLVGLVLLAPMYGGAALLIREVTRRTGRGWPTMVLLALAYGLFEEGITTGSLFNPDYAHAHLLERGYVPALGIAVPWTLFVLTLHTVWSISTPILIVEELTARRTTPWLGRTGLAVSAVLFVLGAAATLASTAATYPYVASAAQYATVAVVVVALAVIAPRLPVAHTTTAPDRPAPAARVVLVAGLVCGALFIEVFRANVVISVPVTVSVLVFIWLAVRAWSRRAGWGPAHRAALASAAILTYAWHSFLSRPVVSTGPALRLASHVFFALAAVALLLVLWRTVRHHANTNDHNGQTNAALIGNSVT